MKLKQIYHTNLIGHEINESVSEGYDSSDREIYCKKLHKIFEPNAGDCEKCSYFAGRAMGHGIECKWEDVPDEEYPDSDEKVIHHKDRRKEMLRVSELIDKGILKKG